MIVLVPRIRGDDPPRIRNPAPVVSSYVFYLTNAIIPGKAGRTLITRSSAAERVGRPGGEGSALLFVDDRRAADQSGPPDSVRLRGILAYAARPWRRSLSAASRPPPTVDGVTELPSCRAALINPIQSPRINGLIISLNSLGINTRPRRIFGAPPPFSAVIPSHSMNILGISAGGYSMREWSRVG